MTGPLVLVTCSRSWRNWDRVREVLGKVLAEYPGATLVHGDAARGDRDCERIWRELGGGEVVRCRADWALCGPGCKPGHRKVGPSGEYCPTAGHRRNAKMVGSGPDLVLAFVRDGSAGASSTAALAERAGIPTVRYEED